MAPNRRDRGGPLSIGYKVLCGVLCGVAVVLVFAGWMARYVSAPLASGDVDGGLPTTVLIGVGVGVLGSLVFIVGRGRRR